MTQPGNQEWATLIECISQRGQQTRPWFIFKGKQHNRSWFTALLDAYIAMSNNGWTNNEIRLE
jgi:hypothetical protein